MNTRALHNAKLDKLVMVRLLHNGDTATVSALYDRIAPRSDSLDAAARVDGNHHALVAYVDEDLQPAAMARLARSTDDPRTGEIAVHVADNYQDSGLGTQLVEVLLADVRAAGIAYVGPLAEAA